MKRIVLVQPHEGVYNKVLKPWIPLSLLSTVVKLDEEGYPISIIDQRLNADWSRDLIALLSQDPVCVGITSMTGSQILGGLKAARIVKQHSRIPVVWGGVHSSIFPRLTLEDDLVDIVVRGEGEITFYELVKRFEGGHSLEGLQGVWFKRDGQIVENPDRDFINMDDFPTVPYHLVNLKDYLHQFFGQREVLEIESSRGCPYACAFCYNPLYGKRKWRALGAENVIGRIQTLVDRDKVRCFHFIDDGFFIDRDRVNQIMEGIVQKGFEVKLGFQGARIDTLRRMSDEDMNSLCRAGGVFLQFGVESGSPRILRLINKQIEVDEVIELNRRLARFPSLIPYYNFMCGFPTETREDLFMTTSLAWQLLAENPQAMISPFHHYKPYPGTPLAKVATDENYITGKSLEEWGHFDWTEGIKHERDKSTLRLLKNVEMVSIFADRKMESQSDSRLWAFLGSLYRPIARLRLRHNFYSFMPEGRLLRH